MLTGPVSQVRDIVNSLAVYLGKTPNFVGSESNEALIADDGLARETIG